MVKYAEKNVLFSFWSNFIGYASLRGLLNFHFRRDVGVVPPPLLVNIIVFSTRLIHGARSVQPNICRSSILSNVRELSMRLGRQEWFYT